MRALVWLCCLAAVGLAAAQDAPCNYIIQEGDSIFGIGQKYGLTQAEVVDANPQIANIGLIQPGDVIFLPCAGNATEGDNIFDWLSNRDDFTVLFQAVVGAGWVDMLNDTKLVGTFFSPNDTAFEAVLLRLNLTAADLLADRELLKTLLEYHFVPEEALETAELTDQRNLTTMLAGESLIVFKPRSVTRLLTTTGRKVRVQEEYPAGKAIVHKVKSVLWPANDLLELPPPSADCIYTVKTGDTLFTIAKDAGTTTDALIELNPDLEATQGASLSPGDKIILFASCSD